MNPSYLFKTNLKNKLIKDKPKYEDQLKEIEKTQKETVDVILKDQSYDTNMGYFVEPKKKEESC